MTEIGQLCYVHFMTTMSRRLSNNSC